MHVYKTKKENVHNTSLKEQVNITACPFQKQCTML